MALAWVQRSQCVSVCIRRRRRDAWSWKSSPFPFIPVYSQKVICRRLCLFIFLVRATPWGRQNTALPNQWRSRLGIHFLWRSGLLKWREQETTLSVKPSLIQNWRHVKMWDSALLGRAHTFFPRPTYRYFPWIRSTVQQCQVHFSSWVWCTFFFLCGPAEHWLKSKKACKYTVGYAGNPIAFGADTYMLSDKHVLQ